MTHNREKIFHVSFDSFHVFHAHLPHLCGSSSYRTASFFPLHRQQRSMGHQRLLMLQSGFMVCFSALFMTFIEEKHEKRCMAAAICLHYLLISMFMTTLAHAVFILQRLIVVFHNEGVEFAKKLSVTAIFG